MPREADLSRLPREVRAELRSLSSEAAEFVGKHLVAAGDIVDEDPALALRHAQAAKRRGARLPLVREALAETAYAAEDFGVALNEYRALRRMTGDSSYFPVMADCERALGKPEEALRLIREAKTASMTQRTQVELVIVEAGAREDLGQAKEGLRSLKSALSHVSRDIPHEAHARLAYAYAAMLLRHGQEEQAREWFGTADRLDVARELDAADQLELLDGLELEFDFEDEDEDDEDQGADQQAEIAMIGTDRPEATEAASDAEADEVTPDLSSRGEDPRPLGQDATVQAESRDEEGGTPAQPSDLSDDVVEAIEGRDALSTEEELGLRRDTKQDADE